MSRIGNAPITIPTGVEVVVNKGGKFGHQQVVVTGPKGSLSQDIRPTINAELKEGNVVFTRDNDQKQTKSYHGLYRSLVNNMVMGVTEGFKRELEIIGIGYRAEVQGDKVVFSLGYAHKIEYPIPAGIEITVNNQTEIIVSGVNAQLVGEVAAKIHSFREPEPYKGKGIRYKGEQVRRKSVKKAA